MIEMSSGGIGDDSTDYPVETAPMTHDPHAAAPHALHPRQPHNVKGPAQGTRRQKFFAKFTPPTMPNVKFPKVSSPFKKSGNSSKSSKPPPPPRYSSQVQRNTVYVDLENRDPYNLNNHVKTGFEEVIGEPDGAHSDPRVWSHAQKSFNAGRNCCFTVLTWLCAIPLVFCWGCNFACISFTHIYSITPFFRVFFINCDCASKFFSTLVHCACDPIYEAIALTFTKVYVNFNSNTGPFQDRTYAGTSMFSRSDISPLVTDPGQQKRHRSFSAEAEEYGDRGGTASTVMTEERIGSVHSIHSLHDDPVPPPRHVQTYVNAQDEEHFIVEEDRRSAGKGNMYQDV